MTFKQKSIITLAIFVTLLPLTGLPLVWKSGLVVVVGLLIIGVSISDWLVEKWRDSDLTGSVAKKVKLTPRRQKPKNPTDEAPSLTSEKPATISQTTLESKETTIPTVPVYTWPTETSQLNEDKVNSGN
jgi:hypothetical protein